MQKLHLDNLERKLLNNSQEIIKKGRNPALFTWYKTSYLKFNVV